ncbi:MAG: helix-turn-helix domain-containing protein [Armatimonadetes bacterium]|nr:helix-turn-helix domain-containing protein [Armatimonadota bacterium]
MEAPRPRIPCPAALGAIGVPAKRWATRIDLYSQLEAGKAVLARGDGSPVSEAAREAGMSVERFQRVFRETEGVDPSRFAQTARLGRARTLLRGSDVPVVDLAFLCGYQSASGFSRAYRRRFGRSPSSERPKMSDRAQLEAAPVA